MSGEQKTQEVTKLVHALAHLPGSRAVNVMARRLARISPTEHGANYDEKSGSYPITDLPASVSIPADTEEIIITLRGNLDQPESKTDLMRELDDFFGASGVGGDWGMIVDLPDARKEQLVYELTVFTNVMTNPPA